MSSIIKLAKQAARMKQQMEQIQATLAVRTVEATSGGGAVKVVARCDATIESIKLDPAAVTPSDPQLLEDLVLTAVNKALGDAKAVYNAEIAKVTAGFDVAGLM
jgi:nucleoid-associated protein EbfC